MKSFVDWLASVTYYRRNIMWCWYTYAIALAKNGFKPRRTVLFYPDVPLTWHIIHQICAILGYRMTSDLKAPFDIAMEFQDTTLRPDNTVLIDDITKNHRVLNINCKDIGKDRVDRIFEETFGYGMTVDPRTHQGPYIKKIITNALHDVQLLDKPSEPVPGYVYQKFIDNKSGEDSATDIRTFIFGDEIPFTLYRKKSIGNRFHDDSIIATRVDVHTAFTQEEQNNIIRFCRAFGLDYGELDVLRDNKDGKIYIVDVNNTPSGPQSGIHMDRRAYWQFRRELAAAFERLVEKEIAKSSK